MDNSTDLSIYIDFEEISLLVEKLRTWMGKFGPLTEVNEDELSTELEKRIWSDVSNDNTVDLSLGILRYADRYFVSEKVFFDDEDYSITTALWYSCPICKDAQLGEEEDTTSNCICEGKGRLFLDLERLLETCTKEKINYWFESA